MHRAESRRGLGILFGSAKRGVVDAALQDAWIRRLAPGCILPANDCLRIARRLLAPLAFDLVRMLWRVIGWDL
jgi:hypothetical protein